MIPQPQQQSLQIQQGELISKSPSFTNSPADINIPESGNFSFLDVVLSYHSLDIPIYHQKVLKSFSPFGGHSPGNELFEVISLNHLFFNSQDFNTQSHKVSTLGEQSNAIDCDWGFSKLNIGSDFCIDFSPLFYPISSLNHSPGSMCYIKRLPFVMALGFKSCHNPLKCELGGTIS